MGSAFKYSRGFVKNTVNSLFIKWGGKDMESVVFKKSLFGGFKKKNVLTYIDAMSKDAQNAENELNGQINSLTDSRNALQKQVDEFSQRVDDLEAQLTTAKEKIRYLTLENKKMQSELLKINMADKEEDLSRTKRDELLARIEELEEKGSKYDEISIKLGAIYIEAHQAAEKLVEDAQKRSALVAEEANQIIDNLAYNIEDFRDNMDMLHSDVKASVYQVEQKLTGICKALDEALVKFKNKVLNDDLLDNKEELEKFVLDSGMLTSSSSSEDDVKLSHYFK